MVFARSLTPRKGDRNWWTEAEVEALVEGVKAYFHPNQSSIPWKLVLAFGTGRFNPSRTVTDLKDKWRNIHKERSKRAAKGM
ncbi:hypothetical protein M569_15011 [Genlisea aurea]|uniref:Myb-like domain-containing protein n=1 Tax=Genlisea aurea TaxID=192259 RepID=S8BYZ0_9LAMI|nr:hypothetical protein M569_15011 [Genlisea aurea]